MHLLFWDRSKAYYKQSVEKANKSVEELTVDLHEAILSLDTESIERLVAEGANPNLSIDECAYQQNDMAQNGENTFEKRLERFQRACLDTYPLKGLMDHKRTKVNAINLVLFIRACFDITYVKLKEDATTTREKFDKYSTASENIDDFVEFLVFHETTILGKARDNNEDDDEDSSLSHRYLAPAVVAEKLASNFQTAYPNFSRANSLKKLQRQITCANEHRIAEETKECKRAMSRWENLLEEMKFADITFQCPDGTVSAHKCVLVSNVEYFAKAFSNSWKEATTGVWKTDKSRDVMDALIKYIYTGTVPNQVLRKHANHLLIVSTEYQMTKLQKICKDWLVSDLSESNVCEVLHFSHVHDIQDVKNDCLKFLRTNAVLLMGKPHILQFGLDHPDLWKEVNDHMESSYPKSKKRRRELLTGIIL